jgi:hypothetical protein
VSNLTYSQRIRVINGDTIVSLTKEQAKAINDTFIAQRKLIKELQSKTDIIKIDTIRLKEKEVLMLDSIQNSKVGIEGWLFLFFQISIFGFIILVI